MNTMKRKILKRAKSIRRKPATEHDTKNRKLLATALGVALLVAWRRRRSRKAAKRLRNDQGVGPAHIKGVPRGEEVVAKEGAEPPGHVAGRLVGSIRPA